SASSECVSAFDLISAPFGVKMSQKPSLPQSLQTVQLVLTGNSPQARKARATALIHALAATLLKPAGAQRNTQNPHIVKCEGVVAISATSLPAPTVSPLSHDYREQMQSAAEVLNGIKTGSVHVAQFQSLADGVKVLANLASEVELPE
ncbi:MAG: hypothetical protein ABR989_02615, partial [Candidatus Binatus soli]